MLVKNTDQDCEFKTHKKKNFDLKVQNIRKYTK